MTTQEILVWTCAYLVELVALVYLTRATRRRVVGALVGGAVVGLMELGAIMLGNARGWWWVPIAWTSNFLPLFYLGCIVGNAPVYLLTWRTVRRFGWRGLAVWVGAVAVIGPPRDYLIAATFPKWMVFSPGLAPIVADSVIYIGIVVLGHAVMRLVAGPSSGDPLARSPKAAT